MVTPEALSILSSFVSWVMCNQPDVSVVAFGAEALGTK
jgi:hypothetical protein